MAERIGVADRLASVLADQREVLGALEDLYDAVWGALDPVLVELARLRIAMLLGCQDELRARTPAAIEAGLDETTVGELANWPRSERFDARLRACLEFVEQFLIDVSAMTSAQTAAVAEHLGPNGLVDFASAVLVLEQRQRMALTWDRLFEGSSS